MQHVSGHASEGVSMLMSGTDTMLIIALNKASPLGAGDTVSPHFGRLSNARYLTVFARKTCYGMVEEFWEASLRQEMLWNRLRPLQVSNMQHFAVAY